MVQTIPTLVFLFNMYMFLKSISSFFAYTPYQLSGDIVRGWEIVTAALTAFNAQMVNLYSLNYQIIFVYLNPYWYATQIFAQLAIFYNWLISLFQ